MTNSIQQYFRSFHEYVDNFIDKKAVVNGSVANIETKRLGSP